MLPPHRKLVPELYHHPEHYQRIGDRAPIAVFYESLGRLRGSRSVAGCLIKTSHSCGYIKEGY